MDFEFETRAVHGGDDPQKRKTKKPSVILDSIDDEEITIENESKLRLEKCIASLEKAKYCLCYPSGTAAITSISMLIGDGDHAVFFDSVYHGTRTNSDLRAACGAIDITFADLRDASVLDFNGGSSTKTPKNFLNPQNWEKASQAIGSIPSPLDCYLCLRGMKTLHLRMERHKENGFQVARFLESHPNVEKVLHPGLESHPQHDLAKKQCTGFSGMVSFCIKGGIEAAREFAKRIKVFTLAVSLGTIESLVDIPPIMTASPLSKETRAELEIPENLIRLSIGIEDARDLIADLDQALRGE
ncbi:Cystathionine gamma-lyase like protein [Argiope bruennichi]|uniref:cystathionine gamma-lyase n=1 Tax=Argiope bruennichi TaxID=94029 RepID=A0A8T0F908_ARGBR|nr:Cystathionine gamma-lyase like protein [Argiope bruennichi]